MTLNFIQVTINTQSDVIVDSSGSIQVIIDERCVQAGPLTIPPSRTSWSSATMRTMLLGLAPLGSAAHLTQQVSSADSSVTAAAWLLCGETVAPCPLLRPAMSGLHSTGARWNTHSHTHTHAAEHGAAQLRLGFVSCSVCE